MANLDCDNSSTIPVSNHRDISTENADALNSNHLIMLVLLELYFDDYTVRLASTPHDVVLKGNTYLGVGNLGTIEVIEENTELQATNLAVTLSGVNSAFIQISLDQDYQGRSAIIKMGLFNESYVLIDDPIILFSGRMDYMNVVLGKESSITLNLESRLVDWERVKVSRYNSADHKQTYPDDSSFDYVEQMVEKELPWGSAGVPQF